MPRIRRFHSALGLVLGAALFQAGCSSLPSVPWISDDNGEAASSDGKQISIRSNPEGAEVLANGNRIGVTPMTVTPANVWSTGFVSGKDYGVNYQYVGNLTIRMPGCKEYTTQVDDYLLRNDVNVKLECDPNYQPVAASPQESGYAVPAPGARVDYLTSEEIMARRLRRLEGLRNRGLITEEEYQQVRRRILGEL